MRLDEETTRQALASSLLLIVVVITIDLWTLDQFAMQRVIGALMGTVLVAFVMLAYIFNKPNLSGISRPWFLTGCAALAIFLFLALIVAEV